MIEHEWKLTQLKNKLEKGGELPQIFKSLVPSESGLEYLTKGDFKDFLESNHLNFRSEDKGLILMIN